MKYYKLNEDPITLIDGRSIKLEHMYEAPYERNDAYLTLLKEQNHSNPTNVLEPDLGYTLYADVDYEYNYYSEKYELFSIATYLETSDWKLPSLNVWLLGEVGLADQKLHDYMFSSIDYQGNKIDPSKALSKDYFELRSNTFSKLDKFEAYEVLNTTAGFDKPEFISKDIIKLYADKENKREMFPMFAKIMLTGMQKSEFCRLIEEYELDFDFMNFIVSTRAVNKRSSQTVKFTTSYGDEQGEYADYIYVYTYEEFLDFLSSAADSGIASHSERSTSTCEFFESFLRTRIFKNKMDEMIKNMPVGISFPVTYRMEKYSSDSEYASVHYFFNYEELEVFRYYDSQISYGQTYEYKIKVINGLRTEDELVFIEEPYYRENILILDSPPIAPDVELLTYRGVDNKVLIMFNQMVDKKALIPIYINQSDYKSFENQYEAQKINLGKPIIFESDDPVDFEFFRLNKKPSEYSEFSNQNYKVIKSNGATAAAFEDTIIPNQVYYYMFRAQDKHGHVSNPTPIYEFVLFKEGETLYPKIRIVDLAMPEPPVQKNKVFKKYVKIGLAPSQYQIPKEEIGNITDAIIGKDINIGISEDNIVGSERTFKFRIRSKNTGKLIDINVTFKKNKVIKA